MQQAESSVIFQSPDTRKRCVGYTQVQGPSDMIMAKTNKSNSANNIKFNVTFGELNVNTMPANAAVLLRNAKKRIDGEMQEVTEFMAVEGVRRASGDGILLPLLALMVADAQERNGFATAFKIVVVNGEQIETKLTAKSTFTRWLAGNVVYKTDSDGKLKNALTLDDGLLLRHTNLNVKKTSPLLTAEGEALSELLKTTAKAIAKQANLRSAILAKAESMYNAAVGTATEPAPVQVPESVTDEKAA